MFSLDTFQSQDTQNDWWTQTLLPFYGIFMMLFCLSTWIIGLIAVMRRGERSWLVWLTLLFGLLVLCLLLFELLVPH